MKTPINGQASVEAEGSRTSQEMAESSTMPYQQADRPAATRQTSSFFGRRRTDQQDLQGSSALRNMDLTLEQPRSRTSAITIASIKLLLMVALFALTIAGYVEALRNLTTSPSPASPPPSSATVLSQVESPASVTVEPIEPLTQTSSGSNPINSPAFVHTLFVAALVIELYLLWRTILGFARSLQKPADMHAMDALPDSPCAERRSPLARFFLGGSPSPATSKPVLPSYDSSLRQAARQSARRRAQAAGVSAGRRGREWIGNGDAEDLDIYRIEKLGGLPPIYKSQEMRKSTIVLRGARPARRDSIASLFSSSGVSERDTSAPPSPGRIAGLLRRLSSRRSTTAYSEHEEDSEVPVKSESTSLSDSYPPQITRPPIARRPLSQQNDKNSTFRLPPLPEFDRDLSEVREGHAV